MKRFEKDCIGDIVSISGLTLSPREGQAAFVTQRPNLEKDGYDSFLHLLDTRTGAHRQLTFEGGESSFCFIEDGEALLFPGLRGEEDQKAVQDGEVLTVFYRLPLSGGEAQEHFRLPVEAVSVNTLSDERVLIAAIHRLDRPELSGLSPEQRAEALQRVRAQRDYEVCDERPYRADGQGYVNKTRLRLYAYSLRTAQLEPVTGPTFAVSSFSVSEDGKTVYFSGEAYDVKQTGRDGIYAWSGGTPRLLASSGLRVGAVAEAGGRVFYCTTGERFDNDIFSVSAAGGVPVLELALEDDAGFHNSGDACRGGGTWFCGKGESLYFVKSDRTGAHLVRFSTGGVPERLSPEDVHVHHFAVGDSGRVFFAGLPEFGPMDIFSLYGGAAVRLTNLGAAVMETYALCQPRYLPFESRDGTPLDGWVILPPEAQSAKVPVILLIHGGPRGQYHGTLNFDAQVLASAGYAVIFCNPHGSSGRSRAFADINGRYGTLDYDDLMDFVDAALASFPQLDGQRMGVTGASYGGYMTNWIITHTDRFRAAVAQCSISNWVTMYGCSDIPWFVETTQNGTPFDGYENLWRSSPLRCAENAHTPTLFLQYMCDYRCPMDQALQMYSALHCLGVDTRLVLFEGDSHVMIMRGKPTHRVRRHSEMLGWFDRYLK